MHRIGLISDTHGLLRPSALAFLAGCERIVHAGDICEAGVCERLAAVAPLSVVRGNNDRGGWADRLPETLRLNVGGVDLYVLHDLAELAIEPEAAGIAVVVSGHSHKPMVQRRGAVLYVNPGSAGPRRFALPISVGELTIDGGEVTARIVELAA